MKREDGFEAEAPAPSRSFGQSSALRFPEVGDRILHPSSGLSGVVSRTAPGGWIVDLGSNRSCYASRADFKNGEWRHWCHSDSAIAPARQPEVDYQKLKLTVGQADEEDWLSPENLEQIAEALAVCDYELLAELRKIFPSDALQAACKLLDADTREQIKKWVIQQNVASYGQG